MKSMTRLREHLETGWVLTLPGEGFVIDETTGNRRPGPDSSYDVSVSIQQPAFTGMEELGVSGIRDERVAVILPAMEIPDTATLTSPSGQVWNAKGDGIIRRGPRRAPRYTALPVRRAKEKNR